MGWQGSLGLVFLGRQVGRSMVRAWGMAFAIVILSVPVTVILTLLMVPVWRWLERSYDLESIGHSGPAGWCYIATFLVCVSTLVGALYVSKKKRGRPGRASDGSR